MALIGQDIPTAVRWLEAEDVVGIPTETVYGLAGNALSEKALLRIFEVKQRPFFDPLILHVASVAAIGQWVSDFPAAAQHLAQHFMPGPLTLVLRKKPVIPDLVSAGMDTVAIRVPRHPLTQALLAALPFPLAAPSANPFGYISPTTAAHVDQQLGTQIPYILDGGPCQVGLESTIVDFSGEEPVVLRKGGLAVEQLEAFLGQVRVLETSSSNPRAPGMLESHYAPATPMTLDPGLPAKLQLSPEKIAGLCFDTYLPNIPVSHQYMLSPASDLEEAARNLFKALRHLEAGGYDLIVAEKVPDTGLGRAINDRLMRAAGKDNH